MDPDIICDAALPDTAQGLRSSHFRQFKQGTWRDLEDLLAPEEVLRIHWPGQQPKELLAFPDGENAWRRLALGHALLDICPPGQRPVLRSVQDADFHLEPEDAPVASGAAAFAPLEAGVLLERMGEFIQAEGKWEHTGCFHRMALFDPIAGAFVAQVEDIGRHNCLDRLAGFCLEQDISPQGLALFASARATGSLVSKAVRAGFALLVSRSAVTTAGMRRAEQGGLTLVGFAREIRFTVFADPRGLVLDPEWETH